MQLNFSFDTLLKAPHVLEVMNACEEAGYPIRIVGGAVRDALLGRVIHDIDMAVAAKPCHVMKVLRPLCHVVPTGLSHGTVTAIFKDHHFQITSLRSDKETFGRHADVHFHDSFEEDALRRDFTINALYVDRFGKLHDYVGGVEDLSQGIVRFIGCPTRRIQEDYLRILRFFRMNAFFGQAIDHDGLDACANAASFLKTLSRERIRAEFFRILTSPKAFDIVQVMHHNHILPYLFHNKGPLTILPLQTYTSLPNGEDYAHKGKFPFLKEASRTHAVIKLFLLIQEISLDEIKKDDVKKLYVLTRNEKKIYALLHKECIETLCSKKGSEKKSEKNMVWHSKKILTESLALWSFYYGKDEASQLLRVMLSLTKTLTYKDQCVIWGKARVILSALKVLPLPVTAEDLLNHGVPSHHLSATLTILEKKWCASSFTLTQHALLQDLV